MRAGTCTWKDNCRKMQKTGKLTGIDSKFVTCPPLFRFQNIAEHKESEGIRRGTGERCPSVQWVQPDLSWHFIQKHGLSLQQARRWTCCHSRGFSWPSCAFKCKAGLPLAQGQECIALQYINKTNNADKIKIKRSQNGHIEDLWSKWFWMRTETANSVTNIQLVPFFYSAGTAPWTQFEGSAWQIWWKWNTCEGGAGKTNEGQS